MTPAAQRESAAIVRRRIARGVMPPAAFRAALLQVPAVDRDAWVDRVLGIDGIEPDGPELPRGCVPYLPCTVATLLDAIELAEVGPTDLFVDVGAGAGRALALTHLLTGATCLGLEIQPTLARAARELLARSRLTRCTVVRGDAAELGCCLARGSVFFLYCPFGGERLTRVLRALQAIARTRAIHVCCVDLPVGSCEWSIAMPSRSPDLVVYASRPPEPRERSIAAQMQRPLTRSIGPRATCPACTSRSRWARPSAGC